MKCFKYTSASILIIITLFSNPNTLQASFPDVPSSHVNAIAINYLQSKGVVSGAEDGNFYPNNVVSRAEILKMTFLSQGMTPQYGVSSFPDVPETSWFAPYVLKAYNSGIVSGYNDGLFRPHQVVSRIEALKIVENSMGISPTNSSLRTFNDVSTDSWYAPYVSYAVDNNLFDVTGSIFQPTLGMTRGEVAEMLYRFTQTNPVNATHSVENRTFSNVVLYHNVPHTFAHNEWFVFRGRIESNSTKVSVVFSSNGNNPITCFTNVNPDMSFELPCKLDTIGTFKLGIFPGSAGPLSNDTYEIKAMTPDSLDSNTVNASDLSLEIFNNRTLVKWDNHDLPISKLTFKQGGTTKEIILTNYASMWDLDFREFTSFKEGTTSLQISLADSQNGSLATRTTDYSAPVSTTFKAMQHHFQEQHDDKITLSSIPWQVSTGSSISLEGTAKTSLSSTIVVITPAGTFREYKINPIDPAVQAGTHFEFTIPLENDGSYILEINENNGFAVLNRPIYVGDGYPIVPDFVDLQEDKSDIQPTEIADQRTYMLNLINQTRSQYGVPQVYLDDELNDLAQMHSDDMGARMYISHYSPEGDGPEDRRDSLGIKTPVGENVAMSIDIDSSYEGLLRSAIHLQNIVDPDWRRVGLGITQGSDGYYYVTQEFSTRDIVSRPLSPSELAEISDTLIYDINSHRSSSVAEDAILSNDVHDWHVSNSSQELVNYLVAKGYSHLSVLTTSIVYYPEILKNLAESPEFQDNDFKKVGVSIIQNGSSLEIITAFLK